MPDYQRVVEEIRFALQSQVCELTERLRESAEGYAEGCRETNARLRRCDALLRQGRRSEAIHLADAEPGLLDLIALLDLPEWEEWQEIAALYDLPSGEPLLLDIAEELNEAYVVEQPLLNLLARHRRLALARAPLKLRLDVMRKLGEVDSESHFWDEDIRKFEQVRMRELEEEAVLAARQEDADRIRRILQEIQSQPWRESVPKKLLTNVNRMARQLSQLAARRELEGLIIDLELALNELDVPRARQLRDKWLKAAKNAQLAPDDPLSDRAEPILGWIADEDEHEAAERQWQAALVNLERALDEEFPLPELEQSAQQVFKWEREIPALLHQRYRNRVASLEVAQTREQRLRVGSVLAVMLLVAVLVGVLAWQQYTGTERTRIAQTAQGMIEARQFDEARRLLEDGGRLTSRRAVPELWKLLADAESQEQERSAKIQGALTRAESAESRSVALAALEEARPLAVTDTEKLTITAIQQDWEDRERRTRMQAEQAVQSQISAARTRLQQVEQQMSSDRADEEAGTELALLERELPQLQTQANPLGSTLAGQVDLLLSQTRTLQEQHSQWTQRRAAETALTKAALVGLEDPADKLEVGRFAEALRIYAEQVQRQSPVRADELRETLAERNLWEGVVKWEQMLRGWRDLWPESADEVRRRRQQCESFVAAHAGCPQAKLAGEYGNALRAMLLRDEGPDGEPQSGHKARIERIFSHRLISRTWSLTTLKDEMFYLPEEADYTGQDFIRIRYYAGFQEADLVERGRRSQELRSIKTTPSPQRKAADLVRERIDRIGYADWEPFFLELSQTIVQSENMDPFLKYDLLKRTLESAAAGSPFLETALSAPLGHLQRADIDPLTVWMNPENIHAPKSREAAAEVLSRLSPLPEAWERADELKAAFGRRMQERARMIGWATEQSGDWQCRTEWQPLRNGPTHRLVVVYSDGSTERGEWRTVGRTTSVGQVQIDGNGRTFLREGRPVFALEPTGQQGEVSSR